MADDGEDTNHSEGIVKDKFCALRKSDCGHNQYVENCRPNWDYITYPQVRTQTIEVGRKLVERLLSNRRSFEAHHLLCVASVTRIIAKGKGISTVVRQTKWCVNYKPNMYAMPMWAHTLRWYCSMITGALRTVTLPSGALAPALGAPPFANIPQHDYGHGSWIDEMDGELETIANTIRSSKKKHKKRSEQLASDLNGLVTSAKGRLAQRGSSRCDGTHDAWTKGLQGIEDWYLPFSMAATGEVEPRSFPSSGADGVGKMAEKIQDLVKGFWAGAH